jgi:PAS domain S-box-containing protein
LRPDGQGDVAQLFAERRNVDNRAVIDDAARFPIENPNPVFRAAADGEILFANQACTSLLVLWGTAVGGRLPPDWQRRIADVLARGEGQRVSVPCEERVFELDLVPILPCHYVNVYGHDVTEQETAQREREALLAELTLERSRLTALAAELERERDRQQTLMENTNASLVYLDRDFNFVDMNAAYEAACQRPRAEMLGRNHFDLFPNAENEAIFRQVRDTGQPVEFLAKPFEFADQHWRGVTYWDWTLRPVKHNRDEVEGLVFSLVDVTERIRAEKLSAALNEIHLAIGSKLVFGEIMQTLLTQSVGALSCTSGAIALRENGSWVTSHAVGLPEHVLGAAWTDAETPDLARAAATRQPVAILDREQASGMNRGLMASYGVRALLAVPLLLRDEAIGVLIFNYDAPRMAFSDAEIDFVRKLAVSASLALENARLLEGESQQRQAAEQRAAELEATLNAINDGVVMYDREGKFVRQNPAALRILGFEETAGQMSIAEAVTCLRAVLVDDPDAPLEKLPIFPALRGEALRSQLMRIQPANSPDGPGTYIMVNVAPILDAARRRLGAVISFSDVSELRRARDELEMRVLERTAELEAIFTSLPDAIIVGDENGITRCNRAALDSFGCDSIEELHERTAALAEEVEERYADTGQRIPPGEEIMALALRGQRVVREVISRNLKTNQDVVHRSAAAPIIVNGKIIAAVCIATDITQQKRAQAQIVYQANLLAHISDAVIATDQRYCIRSWNHAAEELFGWQESEVLGRSIFEILPTEFVDTSAAEVYRQLENLGHWRGELLITRRDGSLVRVEATGVPVRDANGQIIGQVGVDRDITEQRRAQERIAYQAKLLENVNDAVIAYDGELRITAWNRAAEEQYGWKADEVMGVFFPNVVGSQMIPEQRADIERSMAETGRWQGELRHTRRDGTPIVVEATSMALRDDTGRLFAQVTVNRDITERKRAEEELKASREQLQNLSRRLVELQEGERSYVANQLYNDEGQRLSALLIELGIMAKEADGNPTLAGRIAGIKERVEGILADMHSLAVNLRPASLDHLGLIPALCQYAEGLGRQYGLAIPVEAVGLRDVNLSPEAETTVYRIAQQALDNALRHSGASHIDIVATQHDGRLVLIVEDDGAGFDVDDAMRCGRLGILGMRERADMLGGCLTIESTPGRGTSVYIEIPFQVSH